jgi:uncharacterized protein (TIGR00661 family)
MAYALQERNADVDFLFSGREKAKYFSMEAFGDFAVRRGLTFITEQGKVNYLKTVADNSIIHLYKEITQLDLSEYDLVINDFEPVSAWAARLQKVPCIGLSHQNAFRYQVPKKGDGWIDNRLIHHFAPADIHLGLHWYHFNQPILPPIVHTGKANGASHELKFNLVYLPFESLEDITDLLLRFTRHQFVCYHPQIIESDAIENIRLEPLSHVNFQQDLCACEGVIANGGFELPSEALSLGKKLLLKPLAGQFEQESNVATLEHLGLAHSMDHLNPSSVRAWLDERAAESIHYPDVASHISDWILQGNWDHDRDVPFWDSLWDKVDFPSYASIHD